MDAPQPPAGSLTRPIAHQAKLPVPMRSHSTILLAAITTLLGSARVPSSAAAEAPPNIVFILADDLGWTDVGCYGSNLYRTPRIDHLATQGTRFTNSYAACNVCSPTRASIMTGKYPARLHLTDYIPGQDRGRLGVPPWTQQLRLKEFTIAEALRTAGYVCGHFGKWHLNADKNYRPGRAGDPASQGFDEVLTTQKPKSSDDPYADPHHVEQITDAAIGFIEHHRERPFFCYVTHNSVHRPVIARTEQAAKYASDVTADAPQRSAAYAAMVEDLDTSVGRVLDKLNELELSDQTLVIFTSDNGGFLGDEKDNGTSNRPLRGGKGTNFEGGVRVPTVVRWPDHTRPDTVCDESISTVDFYPTLVEIAGVEAPRAHRPQIDGVSIRRLLDDAQTKLDGRSLFWHYPHYHTMGATPHGAIRRGDWKLIEFYEDMHVELYNLSSDIGESDDRAGDDPERAAAMQDELHQWRADIGAQMPIRRDASQTQSNPGTSEKATTVRVGAIVLKWIRGDKSANLRRAERMIREAAAGGAQVICTTECFLDGYAIADKSIPLDTFRGLGESIPDGPYFKRLAQLADELDVHLIAGMSEAAGESRYNTAVLFDTDGHLAGKYRKQKLGHELVRHTPGEGSPVFETPYGRVGIMICADRTVPSLVRNFCTAGADFLICPSGGMFGPSRNDPFVQARSRENQLPIVFVHPAEFLVTGPDGSILSRTILGNRLLIQPGREDTVVDENRVFYYDLPIDGSGNSQPERSR